MNKIIFKKLLVITFFRVKLFINSYELKFLSLTTFYSVKEESIFSLESLLFMYGRMYIQIVCTKERVEMANTKAVNFRADTIFYQKTKEGTCRWKNFCVRCPKCSTSKNCQRDCGSERICFKWFAGHSVSSGLEDLKKEILVGHQEIAQGKSHFCSRCEKGIWSWLSWNAIRSFLQIELSRTCVIFTTIFLWIFIASKLQMAKSIWY